MWQKSVAVYACSSLLRRLKMENPAGTMQLSPHPHVHGWYWYASWFFLQHMPLLEHRTFGVGSSSICDKWNLLQAKIVHAFKCTVLFMSLFWMKTGAEQNPFAPKQRCLLGTRHCCHPCQLLDDPPPPPIAYELRRLWAFTCRFVTRTVAHKSFQHWYCCRFVKIRIYTTAKLFLLCPLQRDGSVSNFAARR